MGGVAELLSGSWVVSGGVLGVLGEVLGVMLAPKMRFGEVHHRLLGVIFEVFEVLGGLGCSGRVLKAVLHGSWAVWQSS